MCVWKWFEGRGKESVACGRGADDGTGRGCVNAEWIRRGQRDRQENAGQPLSRQGTHPSGHSGDRVQGPNWRCLDTRQI